MADERVTAELVLKNISERHLECQICMDRFKKPKMLECSHSFCSKCLQQLAETNPTSQILTCPVCRGETLLATNGVADLRTDFKLVSLLDEIAQHETELQNQQDIQSPSQGSKCSKHTDKDVIMYCDSCKQLICTTCIAKDHKMHPATELNEVIENCKKKADEIFAEVEQHHINFNTALQDIAKTHKTLDSMFAATRAKISKKADQEVAKEVARIREEELKIMRELDQHYKVRAKKIELAGKNNNNEMTMAKNKKYEAILLMDEVTSSENLNLIEKLLQDLNDYTEIQPKQVPQGLTYMDFEDDQKSLGRLVVKDEQELETAASAEDRTETVNPHRKLTQKSWMLKTEITTYMYMSRDRAQHTLQTIHACDVASFSDSDIVVCDLKNHTLIKILAGSFSLSKVVTKQLLIKDLTKPRSVTVNNNDELIVVDNRSVKIFNRTLKCLKQFALGGQLFFQPSCIAVDDNNLIAVGFGNQSKISLYKPDGFFIRTLSAPGIGQYLTIHKQQLIYTTRGDKKIVSINYHGDNVFSVDINQSGWPYGLCCDKDGSIYVAVWDVESLSGEIQHYSPHGKYIGCIIKGRANPNGIALTPAGDLVVAIDASVKIYKQEQGQSLGQMKNQQETSGMENIQ